MNSMSLVVETSPIHKKQVLIPSDIHLKSPYEVGMEIGDVEQVPGIDFISLWIPVAEVVEYREDDWLDQQYANGLEKRSGTWAMTEHGHMKYGVKFNRGRASTCWLEFNPSTLLYGPKSSQIATYSETWELVIRGLQHVGQFVRFNPKSETIRISRLDVTRDIDYVQDMRRVAEISKPHLESKRIDINTYESPKLVWHSMTQRSKKPSDGLCMYNKSVLNKTDTSTMRFELRCRGKRLKKYCPSLDKFTSEAISNMFYAVLSPISKGLTHVPERRADQILKQPSQTKVFTAMIGEQILADYGYHVNLSQYETKKRQQFKAQYPHTDIRELFMSN